MYKNFRIVALALLVITLALFSTSRESYAARIFLNIGTTNKTSILYPYYVNMIQLFKRYAPDIKPTIIETGASVDNINRIVKKQIDIGMSMDSTAYEAYNGLGKWDGTPVKDLRAVMTYAVNTIPYVVTIESGVTNPKDLTGKKVFPGMRGSGNEAMCELVFGALDIVPDWFRGSLSDAADAMKDRRVICANKTSNGNAPDATFLELQTFIKLLPLNWPENLVTKVKSKYPYFKTAQVPANTFQGQTEPATTWATLLGDVASSSLPRDTVYQYVKACFEGKAEQAKVYGVAGECDFVAATLDMGIPLHAGTVKYFKEIGVNIPENLIPEEAK
ncbi:MAG: TAXI family TRAP transporter solute-binding subunit [Synergistaceae bacterium]|jgi:TRAP transporter TAXI family solute receptor|nr:TAXI family TRAP transporter solute-binding subunit [Synergistaceae bacterium]